MAAKKSKTFLAINYLLVFMWILTGGSVLEVFQRNLLSMVLFVLAVLLLIYRIKSLKQSLVRAFVFAMGIVVFCLITIYVLGVPPQDILKYLFLAFEFLTGGILCVYFFSVFTYAQFQLVLYKVLKFIRLHAIISSVLISFAPFLFTIPLLNAYNNYSANSFLLIFYKVSDQYSFDIGGLALTRNQGLFWEPGVLQFYLNLLLILQLYVVKTKTSGTLLTVFALLTTYSTSAYLIMIIISTPALLRNIKRRPGIYFPLSVVMIALFIPFLLGNLQNKFSGDKSSSSLVRILDVVQQLEVIQAHPATGVGLDAQTYIHVRSLFKVPGYFEDFTVNTNDNTIDRGSTNSVIFLLAAAGLPIGFLWLYAYIKQPFITNRKSLVSILLLLGVFVEPLLLHTVFITFIIGGFMALYYRIRLPKVKSLWLKEKVLVAA